MLSCTMTTARSNMMTSTSGKAFSLPGFDKGFVTSRCREVLSVFLMLLVFEAHSAPVEWSRFMSPHSEQSKPREKWSKINEELWRNATLQDAMAHLESLVREEFAWEVNKLREEQGVSQAEIGRRTGLHQPNVSRLLRGPDKHSPTLETLVKLAHGVNRFLQVSLVSDIPSRSLYIPEEAPANFWPIRAAENSRQRLGAWLTPPRKIVLRESTFNRLQEWEGSHIQVVCNVISEVGALAGAREAGVMRVFTTFVTELLKDSAPRGSKQEQPVVRIRAAFDSFYEVPADSTPEKISKEVSKVAPLHLRAAHDELLLSMGQRAVLPVHWIDKLRGISDDDEESDELPRFARKNPTVEDSSRTDRK